MRKNILYSDRFLFRHAGVFLLAMVWLIPGYAFSQITINGKVTSEATGEALPGVNVLVQGTGTVTNVEGNYTIEVPDENATLVFSFIGYTTEEVPVNGRTTIDVVMTEDVQSLDEVVVVGYGTQKKATLTGAVATVTPEKITSSPAINVTNSLSGLLPGLTAVNRTGEPGNDIAEILIRGKSTTGNNEPLVVVDGVQDVPGWRQINPNDIESISVLKDASAAIYGARAANGVILITTKRGDIGKPTISYSFNQGISQPTRLPKMANSASYAEYTNEVLVRNGQPPQFTVDAIRKFTEGNDPNFPNVNWYDEVLRNFTTQSQHNLSLRGGSETIKYSVSGSFANQDGIIKNGAHNFKRYTLRANLDGQINKNIKVGFDINTETNGRHSPNFPSNEIFAHLRYQLPYVPVYYDNGFPSSGIVAGNNPAIMATDATGYDNSRTFRYLVKSSIDINIPWVKGLGIDGYASYMNEIINDKNWKTPYLVYDYDQLNNTYIPITGGGITFPQLRQSNYDGRRTLLNIRLKYEKNFNDHGLSSFIAAEQEEGLFSNFSAFRRDFLSPAIDELFAGSLINQSTSGERSESGRRNFFGRLSYNFKEKYLFDFNFRYDGSERFPKGKRYGFFPGAAVAWRVSEENFMSQINFISELKLRASYGKMGNDQVPSFQHLALYELGRGYSFGQTPTPTQGLIAGVSPNPSITWEVANMANLGLDVSLWEGMVDINIDVFKQRRSNILTKRNLSVPDYTGLILPNENIGIVENKGIELQFMHRKIKNEFSYSIGGNVGYAKSKIIDLDEATNIPEWQKAKGHVIDASTYYRSLGIIRTEEQLNSNTTLGGARVGDLLYEDVNEDGKIDASDRVRMDKTNIPEVTFGINFSFGYKNFSLFSNFAGQTRAWQYFNLHAKLGQNSLAETIENRYTPGSMDSKYPILSTEGTTNYPSDFWIMDASFVRLKTIELGYDLPENLLSKFNISSMRIYVSGNNLFTIDKLKFIDPENSDSGGNFYPQNKIYNIGINFSF